MKTSRALVVAAALAASCSGKGEFIPTPAPEPIPPTTAPDLTSALPAADPTTTLPPETPTTVEEAVEVTTTLPILCPELSHPRHHQTCPKATETTITELRKQTLTPTNTSARSPGTLASIRACESGGDYTAVSPNGQYRGAYQFDRQTWAAAGGSGDPAAASPSEQDMRAQAWIDAGHRGAWPNC